MTFNQSTIKSMNNNNTEEIKGRCELCGFAYKATIPTPYPEVKCPHCHKPTYNFNDAKTVEENDIEDGKTVEYVESVMEF